MKKLLRNSSTYAYLPCERLQYAKRVADYAAAKGVAIMPGVGSTYYGGAYYEGDHNPMMIELQKNWPKDDPAVFANQAVSYQMGLEAIADRLSDTIGTYATYLGFMPGKIPEGEARGFHTHLMDCARPHMFDLLPAGGICQWTISGMVHRNPLPLEAYMDDGEPDAVYNNACWPRDLKPPCSRNTGFLHQPSQWWGGPTKLGRYQHLISTIKEACLRSYRTGLEGVSIHGEVTAQYVPWALNYLAFSHFIHYPEDSMRGFASKTLAPVLGNEAQAQEYIQLLAHHDADRFGEDDAKLARDRARHFRSQISGGHRSGLEPFRMWHWLHQVGSKSCETQTVSFF